MPASLNPALIRVANIVGWCWLAASAVAIVIFSVAQAPRLMSTLWLFMPPGRTTAAQALPFPTWIVVLCAWLLVAVFAAVMVISRRFSAPTRSWAIVLVILFSWVTSVVIADVVVSAASQLGLQAPLVETRALALISPAAQPVIFTVGLLALVTIIGLPLLALPRSQRLNRTQR
jgi:hypothetical protein